MMNRKECLQEYGSDYLISKKIDSGELFCVGKAVYSRDQDVPYMAVLAFKYPNAIITMHSAFYLHGLTDVIPDGYDLATDRDAAKIHEKNVRQYFIPGYFLRKGVGKMNLKGYEIPVYTRERMLIELIRYKSKLPFDYYKEIILNYRKIMPSLNVQAIQDLALESPKSGKVLETLQTEVF